MPNLSQESPGPRTFDQSMQSEDKLAINKVIKRSPSKLSSKLSSKNPVQIAGSSIKISSTIEVNNDPITI